MLTAERPCRGTLRAEESTRVLALPKDRFVSLIQRRPWFGLELLSRLVRRSEEAYARLHRRLPAHCLEEPDMQLEPTDFF